jgi:hypothetical protein
VWLGHPSFFMTQGHAQAEVSLINGEDLCVLSLDGPKMTSEAVDEAVCSQALM